jgi:hypothetical protein
MQVEAESAGQITSTRGWNVLPLVEEIAAKRSLTLESCLDIGSGARPKHDWFGKVARNPAARFRALEVDAKLRQRLGEMGVACEPAFDAIADRAYDLSIATEVLEHVRAADSVGFLKQIARVTNVLFAMTTPNFEYWGDRLRAKPEHKNIRWIPDHFLGYDPKSDSPHCHKQMLDPELVLKYLRRAFGERDWELIVLRAWPWEVKDLARGSEAIFYFKIFAVAIRRAATAQR